MGHDLLISGIKNFNQNLSEIWANQLRMATLEITMTWSVTVIS